MHEPFVRTRLRLCLASVLLLTAAPMVRAASCAAKHHEAPSEADAAFLAGDFTKSEDLFRSALAKTPDEAVSKIGLIHSLLRQRRIVDASDALPGLMGVKPTPELLTLRAEVELRRGEPWTAAETASASATVDPCNPRTLLVLARLADLNSRHATAGRLLASAHQLDPEDGEITAAWIDTLPNAERTSQLETYLSSPRGDDLETLNERKAELGELRKWAGATVPLCSVSMKTGPIVIPFGTIRSMRGDLPSPALDVKVNQHNVHLWFDTSYNPRLPIEGVSGLLILKSAADHLGLKPLFENTVPGTGPQAPRKGYVAYADSIEVGGLEFRNCAIQVMEGRFFNEGDGAISTNLFTNFLTTLDFPNHKMILQPLTLLAQSAAKSDRIISPDMKDYAPVYRVGTDVIVPVRVNGKLPKLFLVDTGVGYSMLSPEAAHEIAEGHKNKAFEVRDLNGSFERFTAGDVQLSFLGLTQNVNHIGSYDTSRFTADGGMQVSGLLGNATLRDLAIHIDFRDGLMKVDFKSSATH